MWPRDTAKDHASPSVKQYLRVLSESRRTHVPAREECFVFAGVHFQSSICRSSSKFVFLSCVTLIRRKGEAGEVRWTYLVPQRSCRYRKEHGVGSLITTNLARNVAEFLSISYSIVGIITMQNRMINNFLIKLLNH